VASTFVAVTPKILRKTTETKIKLNLNAITVDIGKKSRCTTESNHVTFFTYLLWAQ